MNGIDSPSFSYSLLCAIAAPPIKEAGLPLEFGSGHVIHFSQWNGNMRDITEESKSPCTKGLPITVGKTCRALARWPREEDERQVEQSRCHFPSQPLLLSLRHPHSASPEARE